MPPSDISTYRPAVILLAGFTATFAALLLHQRYVKRTSPASDGGLHRSNAVRRPRVRRRRHGDEPGSSNSSGSATVSELAISRLLAREANGVDYGTFTPSDSVDEVLVGAFPEFRLLPSQLPSVTALLSFGSMPERVARGLQYRIQSVFMYSFMMQEYPRGHLIQGSEAEYLREQLASLNLDFAVVEACIAEFNAERLAEMPTSDVIAGGTARIHPTDTQGRRRLTEGLISADGANDNQHGAGAHTIDAMETVVDDQSHASHHDFSDGEEDEDGVHDVMSLAYRVAEDDSRKTNYVHRGVMCNGCRVQPIQGIRYSCANCPDYDLCEDCEANQIHIKTHIFYKVRIPAPLLGYHRPTAPTWYPGKPHLLTEELREKFPNALKRHLTREYNIESDELQAHWEQFICLATCSWTNDPIRLGVAIDRDGFDKCFCPPTSLRSPPPNLIYDRLFAFYDTNGDGKIGFEEFLKGLVNLKDNSRYARLRRIFEAYDLDNDGFVCRKDFLRLFRAYYSYSKEMAMASVAAFDENQNDPYARDIDRDEVRKKLEGGRPISAIFEGSIPAAYSSRYGVGKSPPDVNGDRAIVDKNGVLEESDDFGNRNDVISKAALAALDDHPLGSSRNVINRAGPYEAAHRPVMNGDPHVNVLPEDIYNALGRHVPFDEVEDSEERARIMYTLSQRLEAEADQRTEPIRRNAVHDRWRKRKFYTDEEEGATAPPGYREADSSDEETEHDNGAASPDSISDTRRRSLRSRSSSKVRFEDDVTDTDYETRSNTSSRSIPVGERWGGYEIRDVERDVGKEVLYQAIQQGFNQLLDPLFKEKEDLGIAADTTRALRRKWIEKSSTYAQSEQASTLARLSQEAPQHQLQAERDKAIPNPTEAVLPSAPASSSDLEPTTPLNQQDPPLFRNDDRPVLFRPVLAEPGVPPSTLCLDPTMPQSRPDSPPTLNSDGASDLRAASPTARTAVLNALYLQTTQPKLVDPLSQGPSSPHQAATEQEPSAETLALWAKHDEIDAEAKTRGGYGKLNFDELSAKMVEEDSTNAALGKDENGDKDGKQRWGSGSSLGRLWFVGTWIEQAAF